MKKAAIFLFLCLVFIIMAHSGIAAGLYDAVSIETRASVSVDGDYTDWGILNLVSVPIEQVNVWSKQGLPRDDSDLSAEFMCFKDTKNVYIVVKVLDDRFVFGEAPFGKLFRDDAVEIMLGVDQSNPLKIWISMDAEGKTKMEGREPQSPQTYPFLQKSLGIESFLMTNSKGYTVEAAIPVALLESFGWGQADELGMNIRVYDDDDGDQCESVIEWTGNPVNPYKDAFNQVRFIDTGSDDSTSETQDQISENVQEVEIVLTEPTEQTDSESLENRLGLALVLEKEGKYSECIASLNDIISECNDTELLNKCKLALGRNYFFLADYSNARKICDDLIGSDADSKIILDARMIVVSIEQKQEQ